MSAHSLKTMVGNFYEFSLIIAFLIVIIVPSDVSGYASLYILVALSITFARYVIRVKQSGHWTDLSYFLAGLSIFRHGFASRSRCESFIAVVSALLVFGSFAFFVSLVPAMMIFELVRLFFGSAVIHAVVKPILAIMFVGTSTVFWVHGVYRLGRRAGGETLRPIPGAGIERRGRGPRRWRS